MNRKFIIFLLVAVLFSCEDTISEFQSENFVKYFGSGYESRGFDVTALSDGNYALTGYDNREAADGQLLIVKVDENGNLIWSGTYGQEGINETGRVVKEVSDGLLIAGVADSAGISRPFILKVGITGDSLWYRSFGSTQMDIEVQDVVLDDTHMYVAGYALQTGNSGTDYYTAKLTFSGDVVWERKYFENSGSLFKRIFLLEEHILLVGDHGNENWISIVTVAKSSGIHDFNSLETTGETLADALLIGDNLYVLVNASAGTLLYKLNSAYKVDWQTAPVSSITGKAVVQHQKGKFLVLGERVEEGNKLITAFSIDGSGIANYGPDLFRTIPGTLSRAREIEGDNGLILIGSTNATYGIKAQLIKTGQDLFLLKP